MRTRPTTSRLSALRAARGAVRVPASLAAALLAAAAGTAMAAPATYTVDPMHTYPSFEADHMGISYWRGKFNRTTGTVTLDKAAGTGTVDLSIDLDSIDYGLAELNDWAKSPQFFDTAKYPKATYTGKLAGFVDGAPTRVEGMLTLHGVSRPVELAIDRFKCIPHPLFKRELCGADAQATFRRDAFGLDAGKDYGFDMSVKLSIQVEALKDS
ncbi:protein yceI precursor [Mizugakiibacter sediminis]|uniref:Protein yceI n=1 Tax=Mizugakiibacter sediminis TaxID=1475481 RepID=A0A0K8QLY3_9GAMM|nr:protein yceI precursor [Mizugakiibacter sediminis]